MKHFELLGCVLFGLQGRLSFATNDKAMRSRALVETTGRSENERIGLYKLLAVRVTSSFGQEPAESLQDIKESIFTNEHSVVNQFLAISHHQLVYEPATASGVLQIELQKRLSRYEEDEDEIVQTVEAMLGVHSIRDVADRILFCLPEGSLDEGVWGLAQFPGSVRCVSPFFASWLTTICAEKLLPQTWLHEARVGNARAWSQFLV